MRHRIVRRTAHCHSSALPCVHELRITAGFTKWLLEELARVWHFRVVYSYHNTAATYNDAPGPVSELHGHLAAAHTMSHMRQPSA